MPTPFGCGIDTGATVGELPPPARADLFELSEVVQEYRLPLLSDLRSSVYESYLLSHGVVRMDQMITLTTALVMLIVEGSANSIA